MAKLERLAWPFLSEIEGSGVRRKCHETQIQVLIPRAMPLLWRMTESASCFLISGQSYFPKIVESTK